MASSTYWVESDLFREGVALMPYGKLPEHEYLAHVSTADLRPRGMLWRIRLSERLPVVPIPLRRGDEHAPLDLQVALDTSCGHARHDTEIDYVREPLPPLTPEWTEWANRLLRAQGLRSD
jgi:hypothetical protein